MLNTLLSITRDSTTISTVVNNLKPFAFCKPLAEAISQNGNLDMLSQPISTLLFAVDVILMVLMILAVGFLIFAFIKYGLKGLMSKDETQDIKENEKQRKFELKRSVKAFLWLSIVFILLPILITIIGAII